MKIKKLEHPICQLGECPVWDEDKAKLRCAVARATRVFSNEY